MGDSIMCDCPWCDEDVDCTTMATGDVVPCPYCHCPVELDSEYLMFGNKTACYWLVEPYPLWAEVVVCSTAE